MFKVKVERKALGYKENHCSCYKYDGNENRFYFKCTQLTIYEGNYMDYHYCKIFKESLNHNIMDHGGECDDTLNSDKRVFTTRCKECIEAEKKYNKRKVIVDK